jgi:hypothetical protein
MFRYENNGFCYMAQVGAPAALVDWDKQRGVFQPGRADIFCSRRAFPVMTAADVQHIIQ